MNQVNLMGRLTADPELRKTKNDTPVCNIILAVNDARNEEADYFPIVVWGKKAEALAKYMRKGEKTATM
ncbi:MAG: single-stranded DNA-binding protein [Acutalibacteraceae bacterium]|nr:single-stranded DNA-binding protein [Acutalibacteraceae bacterium]